MKQTGYFISTYIGSPLELVTKYDTQIASIADQPVVGTVGMMIIPFEIRSQQ